MEEVRPVTLRYAPLAIRQLDSIFNYIAQQNSRAATDVLARIQHSIGLLVSFPGMGHRGVRRGTRELRVPDLPYIVVHRIEPDETVLILGVYHTAQRRPGQRFR